MYNNHVCAIPISPTIQSFWDLEIYERENVSQAHEFKLNRRLSKIIQILFVRSEPEILRNELKFSLKCTAFFFFIIFLYLSSK